MSNAYEPNDRRQLAAALWGLGQLGHPAVTATEHTASFGGDFQQAWPARKPSRKGAPGSHRKPKRTKGHRKKKRQQQKASRKRNR